MKKRSFMLLLVPVMLMLLVTVAGASLRTAHAAALDDPNPVGVPDNLRVPDNEVLVWDGVTSDGNSFQDYKCLASGDSYVWTLIGPSATLTNPDRYPNDVVTHDAVSYGPGFTPEWNLQGSFVGGRSIANSPVDGTIPQLLLQSVSNTPGPFENVNYIQRLDTAGGVAPSDPCNADNVEAFEGVPYSAHYYFYAPAS